MSLLELTIDSSFSPISCYWLLCMCILIFRVTYKKTFFKFAFSSHVVCLLVHIISCMILKVDWCCFLFWLFFFLYPCFGIHVFNTSIRVIHECNSRSIYFAVWLLSCMRVMLLSIVLFSSSQSFFSPSKVYKMSCRLSWLLKVKDQRKLCWLAVCMYVGSDVCLQIFCLDLWRGFLE